MKIFLTTVLLVVASVTVFSQENRNEKIARELMQLERDWITTSLKHDKAWLERFFADEVIVTHPTSGTVKDKVREIADTVDPAHTPDSMTLGEMKVTVTGNTAIVTGTAFEIGGGGHLTDRNRGYLFTDTFIRRSGRWQLLASHSSRLPTEELSAEERRQIEEELTGIENEWAQVIVSRDLSVLERILAPDFVGVDDEGFSNKAAEIASYKQNPNKFTSAVNENVKVHIYTKDAAVVTGEVTIKGTDKEGKQISQHWRWTDTYVRRGGTWQCVASHSTRLK